MRTGMWRPAARVLLAVIFLNSFVVRGAASSRTIALAERVTVVVNGRALALDTSPQLVGGRVLVPLRGVFEALGAEVQWDGARRVVTARRGGNQVTLVVDSRQATVNGRTVALEVPASIVSGHVLVPLRFVSEALGASVRWDGVARAAYVDLAGAAAPRLAVEKRTVTVGGRTVTVHTVRVPRGARLRPVVALGQDRVGGLEELGSMARRHGAVLAVNGSFFNPRDYAQRNGLPTEPWGTLIRGGRVIHAGGTGGAIGFDGLSSVRIAPLRMQVEGGTDGSWDWPHNWFAYGFNHTPGGPGASAVYIYTPERGPTVGYAYGTKVVVSRGRVVAVVDGQDVAIPPDGYVIGLVGADGDQLRDRFRPGVAVDYRVRFTDDRGLALDWPYSETIGAGPVVVENGVLRTDYAAQGFFEAKILSQRGRRTGIGVTERGDLLVVVGDGLTVQELGEAMLALGARQALNLDGNASSGLWLDGAYVVRPGRELSNALLLVPEEGPPAP